MTLVLWYHALKGLALGKYQTRVVQKVLSLIGFLSFIPGIHCTWMVCWIANDTRLFRANCFPTDRVISNWNRCSHIHWSIYLFHWNMDQKTDIRSYIKCRIRLNIDSKQIFNELCGIYGPQTVSIRTVFRCVKAFKARKFSVEDDTCPGRPKTSVTKANITAVKIVVEQDARLSVKDIASCTGISEGNVQTTLKKRLDLKKVCARWVPHLLTEGQKTQRLKCAWELLKTYKGCNSRVISNLLQVMKPGCTCLSQKEGLIISNRSEKIKETPMYCQNNHKVENDVVRNFL